MSKRWRGISATSNSSPSDSLSRFSNRGGHLCVLCGFVPTTKNKYRELQDHLVRIHFRDAIKAALPTRRPYLCPERACSVEGKDWQALMRHYTGKHGILDAYLKEALSNNGMISIDGGDINVHAMLPQFTHDKESLYISSHSESSLHEDSELGTDQVEVVTSFQLLEDGNSDELSPENGSYSMMEDCHEEDLREEEDVIVRKRTVSSSPTNEDAAQINTVSSTIQFPTTIPLMLGATATKRAKSEPDILINNGCEGDNYAFLDLKYFLASPSKVMALPYKILLPQIEDGEDKSYTDSSVQVELKSSRSVQVQTDPWYPSVLHNRVVVQNSPPVIPIERSSAGMNLLTPPNMENETEEKLEDVKELDFSMF